MTCLILGNIKITLKEVTFTIQNSSLPSACQDLPKNSSLSSSMITGLCLFYPRKYLKKNLPQNSKSKLKQKEAQRHSQWSNSRKKFKLHNKATSKTPKTKIASQPKKLYDLQRRNSKPLRCLKSTKKSLKYCTPTIHKHLT